MITFSTDILDELKAPFYRYLYLQRVTRDGAKIGIIIEFSDDAVLVDICDWNTDKRIVGTLAYYREFSTPDEEYHGPAT